MDMKKRKNIIGQIMLILCSALFAGGIISSCVITERAAAKVSYEKKIAKEKKEIKKFKKQLKKAKREYKKAKSDWKSAPDEGTGIFNADVINASPLIIHSNNVLSEGKGYFYIKNNTSYVSSSYNGTIRITGGTYNYDGIKCKVAVELKTKRQNAAGRELRAYAKIERIKSKISKCRNRISYYRKMMNAAFNKVKDDNSNVYRNGDTIHINANQSLKLNLVWKSTAKGTVKWSIGDDSILNIEEINKNKKYELKAGAATGTTTLKAKIKESGVVRKFKVVIVGYPTSITVPESNITLKVGDIYQVNYTVLPETAATEISMTTASQALEIGYPIDPSTSKVEDYEGDGTETFKISSKGPYLRAVSVGTATVTITSEYTEYCTASVTINVTIVNPIKGFALGERSDSPSEMSQEIGWDDLTMSPELSIPSVEGKERSKEYYEAIYSETSAKGYYDLKYWIKADGRATEAVTAVSSNPNVAFPMKTQYYYYADSDDSRFFVNAGTLRIGVAGSGNCDIVIQTTSGVSAIWHITVSGGENTVTACSFLRDDNTYSEYGEVFYVECEDVIEEYKENSSSGFSDCMDANNYFQMVSEEEAFLYVMIPYTYETEYDYIWLGTPEFSYESESEAFFIKFIQCNRVEKKGYVCLGINTRNNEEEKTEYLYGMEGAKTPIKICMDEEYNWYLE